MFSIVHSNLQAVDIPPFREEGEASGYSLFSHQFASLAFSV